MGDTLSNPDVYLGVWTNWSYGPIRGSTLTLTRSNGNALNATLTLFVAWTGTCLWRLICFSLHRFLSSEAPRDGLYHQRQAILRTSGTGMAGLWSLGRLTWSWRKRANNTYFRMAPLVGLAITHVSLFAAAAVFLSRISRARNDEVLLSGTRCGFLDSRALIQDGAYVNAPWISQTTSSSSDYVRRCYRQELDRQDCPTFLQARLLATIERNAACPFNERICQSRFGNMRLDTGFLDSHHHLGLNAPERDRFLYRRTTECAPLTTDGYTKSLSAPHGDGGSIGYLYGLGNLGRGNLTHGLPLTYIYQSQGRLNGVACHDSSLCAERGDYDITFQSNYAGFPSEAGTIFEPVDELRREDADLTIFFLSANNVIFTGKVEDSVYSAHRVCGKNVRDGIAFYRSLYCCDEPTGVLACAVRHQVCNAAKDPTHGCLPVGGRYQLLFGLIESGDSIVSTAAAKAAGLLMNLSVNALSVEDPVGTLGSSSLTARNFLNGGISGRLPDDQWQREVEHWDYTATASMQRQIFDMANGPSNPDIIPYVKRPADGLEEKICRNLKIVSTNYSSFSVLSLVLLLSISTLTIALSYSMEWIGETVRKRRNLDVYSRLEWVANDTLQLQRLAHEELGLGTWSETDGSYPVTEKGDLLAMLDVSDGAHPKLVRPRETHETIIGGDANGDSVQSENETKKGRGGETRVPGVTKEDVVGRAGRI